MIKNKKTTSLALAIAIFAIACKKESITPGKKGLSISQDELLEMRSTTQYVRGGHSGSVFSLNVNAYSTFNSASTSSSVIGIANDNSYGIFLAKNVSGTPKLEGPGISLSNIYDATNSAYVMVNDMEIHQSDNLLYAVSTTDNYLYLINKTTAAATRKPTPMFAGVSRQKAMAHNGSSLMLAYLVPGTTNSTIHYGTITTGGAFTLSNSITIPGTTNTLYAAYYHNSKLYLNINNQLNEVVGSTITSLGISNIASDYSRVMCSGCE